jgi:hypothetical protein
MKRGLSLSPRHRATCHLSQLGSGDEMGLWVTPAQFARQRHCIGLVDQQADLRAPTSVLSRLVSQQSPLYLRIQDVVIWEETLQRVYECTLHRQAHQSTARMLA